MSNVMWRVDSITTKNYDIGGMLIESDISTYITSKEEYLKAIEQLKSQSWICGKAIKQVIFNNPATIIVWQDGTKTVVKCQDGDTYDKEKGFLVCYLKGVVGNKTLLKELDRWVYGEQS